MQRQQRRPPDVGQHRIGHLADLPAEYVGVDLGPLVGVGAAADEGQRVEAPSGELLDRLEQPAGVEGHPLEDGPDHLIAGRGQRQVVEPAPDGVVVDRRPLAVEPRREQHPAAPGGHRARPWRSWPRSRGPSRGCPAGR